MLCLNKVVGMFVDVCCTEAESSEAADVTDDVVEEVDIGDA